MSAERSTQLTIPAIQELKKHTVSGRPIVCMSFHEKVPEKSLVSPSSSHIKWRERCSEAMRQQTWRQVKKPVSSSINYAGVLSNQWIHSVNARGQMDEHLSAIWSCERGRFIFEACLSHFSCLVLEGRACICDFSNARDLQLFYSVWDWALWAQLARTSGFFLLRMGTKGCRFSKGSPSVLVVLSNGRTRLFVSWTGLPDLAVMVGVCSTATSGMGLKEASAWGVAEAGRHALLHTEVFPMVVGQCFYLFQLPRVLAFLVGRELERRSRLSWSRRKGASSESELATPQHLHPAPESIFQVSSYGRNHLFHFRYWDKWKFIHVLEVKPGVHEHSGCEFAASWPPWLRSFIRQILSTLGQSKS